MMIKTGGTTMRKKLLVISAFIILFLLYALPSAAENITYYDNKGQSIEKAEYDRIVNNRAPTIDRILKEGYRDHTMKLEDPILLRKKRIEQWKLYRKTRGKPKA